MLIAIPSKARATRQVTLGSLPKSIRQSVHLAVDRAEIKSYEFHDQPLIIVDGHGIGATRDAILAFASEVGEEKVLMLDDDLTFALRREDDPTKFTTPTDVDVELLFLDVESKLNTYAHVAVAPREGGNRRIEAYIENTRALRALAFYIPILDRHNLKFTDMEVMEDFYIQLSLLTRGHPHLTINWMVQNQGSSNAPGGCSTYRTMEMQSRAAHALKAKFPEFVNVVKKETKTAWNGQPREDVVIAWKKAYASR